MQYADYLKQAPALERWKRAIRRNTQVSYLVKFTYTLKQAFKKKFLYENIAELIEGISPLETHREFLFQDELQRLADTPCASEDIRRASLVAALTGLHFSDIKTL